MSVDSNVCFGKYQQDEDPDSATDIEWMILETQKDKCLLISKNGIEAKAFNDTQEKVTWESSSLRKWLNEDFIRIAFNKEELKDILTTVVCNDSNQGNKAWNPEPLQDTKDKVFLLSYAELMHYLTSEDKRVCHPTEYVMDKGASTGLWWLRSPGRESESACCINAEGTCTSFYVGTNSVMVRPCLWMDLTSMTSEIDFLEQL